MVVKVFTPYSWPSIIRKTILALASLVLVTFVIFHLSGNLLLFSPDPNAFNILAKNLHGLGPLYSLAEIALLVAAVVHVTNALVNYVQNRQARPQDYVKFKSAGKPSHRGLAAVSMIVTGPLLLLFLVWHLKTFRFGPGIAQGYVTEYQGEMIRDLHQLVAEVFQNPWYVLLYVSAIMFLGLHLRHGFASAWISLGFSNPKFIPLLFSLALVVGALLATGFISLPVWLYLTGGQA